MKVCLNDTHSILRGNWRHLRYNYGMEECNGMIVGMRNDCESVSICE